MHSIPAGCLASNELFDRLGYNTGMQPRRPVDITNSTREFRKAYVSPNGTPGSLIVDWTPASGNMHLKEMARAFLEAVPEHEQDSYGRKLWPESCARGLEYPRDKDR